VGHREVLKFHRAFLRLDVQRAGCISFERFLKALEAKRSPTLDVMFNIPGALYSC
jgi:hypothetical protein